MAIGLSNAAAIAAADAVVDMVDAGAGAGYLEIRSGTRPADADTAASGTLLATLTFGDPAFGSAGDGNPGGEASANAISPDNSAAASGTATWFRVYDSDGNAIFDGDVSDTAGDLVLDTVSIDAGDKITISSFTYTQPETEA